MLAPVSTPEPTPTVQQDPFFQALNARFATTQDAQDCFHATAERLVIYQRESSEVTRIAAIVLRADQKDIKPAIARSMLRKLQSRTTGQFATTAADEPARQAVETLIEWIRSWF